ncbi:MAG: hypothetical protein AAB381_01945 [Patescibacteria group bacterium]
MRNRLPRTTKPGNVFVLLGITTVGSPTSPDSLLPDSVGIARFMLNEHTQNEEHSTGSCIQALVYADGESALPECIDRTQ